MNNGFLSRAYNNFTTRDSILREKLLKDISILDEIENTIQDSGGSTNTGIYNIKSSGANSFEPNPKMSITLLSQDALLIKDDSQNMRYAVTQLISKVGSMLQSNGSETRVYLPPELSTLMVNYELA